MGVQDEKQTAAEKSCPCSSLCSKEINYIWHEQKHPRFVGLMVRGVWDLSSLRTEWNQYTPVIIWCWFHSQNHSKSWQNTFRDDKLWLHSLSPLLAFPIRVYPRVVACEIFLTILSLPSGKGKDLKCNGISSRADFCLHLISKWNLQQNPEILKDHYKQRQNPWLLSGFFKVHRCLHISRNLVLQWLPA